MASLSKSQESVQNKPALQDAALDKVEEMIALSDFGEARKKIEACLRANPESGRGHLLQAKIYIEAEGDQKNAQKGLHHAERAVDLLSDQDAEALKVLAYAKGHTGDAEEGIKLMENVYVLTTDEKAQEEMAELVASYRVAFDLGQLWQFANAKKEVFYQSTDISEIHARLVSGGIPNTSLCQKNNIDKFLPVSDSLAKEEDSIDLLFHPIKHHIKLGAMVTGALGGLGGIIVAVMLLNEDFHIGLFSSIVIMALGLFMFLAWKQGTIFGKIIGVGVIIWLSDGNNVLIPLVGVPLGILLSACVAAIPGSVVGLIRKSSLPHLPAD